MSPLERSAAEGGHLALYILLVGLPLTGWVLVSVSVLSIPTVLYDHIPWPNLPIPPNFSQKAPVEAALKLIHGYGAWALIVLVTGHIAAAIRHHFIQRDGVLRRMLLPSPGQPAPGKPTMAGARSVR
jgi:cytochrome b561